jgi:hypothetical protein
MRGFGEDFFVGLLKQQYQLESELEVLKERLIMDCQDFNAIIGFRLFKPSFDRTKLLGISNLKAAFNSLGVTISDS